MNLSARNCRRLPICCVIPLLVLALAGSALGQDAVQAPYNAGALGKDRWLAKDKADHFLLSMFMTGFSFAILHESYKKSESSSLYLSGGVTLSLGLGKEMYDARSARGHASLKDMLADALGVALAYFMVRTL